VIRLSNDGLARWRAEVDMGAEHRDKTFGTYRQRTQGNETTTTLAGRNLDYFEQGAEVGLSSSNSHDVNEQPLNIVFPLVKNVVPTLFYQNPRATATPLGQSKDFSTDDAFYVSEFINADLKDIDFRFKETSQLAVFDSFVLGFGVVKIGYATKFGPDILPTKGEERATFNIRMKAVARQVAASLGIPQKPEPDPDPEKVQGDGNIKSESPYVSYVSPFDFVIDPRARDMTDARWVAQRIRRTIAEIKRDRRYSDAKNDLSGEPIEDDRILDSFVEEFQVADVWEVHYKDEESPTGISILTFAATQTQTKALMHEHSVYNIGGWQFEWLAPNKHAHRLYPISVLSIMRPLIDRLNGTFDAILEQIDKFQSKVAFNERVTKDGQDALDSPTIGARVEVEGTADVNGAIAVISMQQVKGDLMNFVNQVVDLLLIIVGVTRAQFTGLTSAETATEANIGQSGQNLRRTDEGNVVGAWSNRVVAKLWRVKAQFQDLVGVELTQETDNLDPRTGIASTQWFPPIDEERAQRLKKNKFRFALEVGSIQKPNLDILRAQFEQFVRALMEPVVTNGLALEGKRVSATEVIRQWSRFFSEGGLTNMSKIVVPANQEDLSGLMGFGQKPGATGGPNGSAASASRSRQGVAPTVPGQIAAAAGPTGQGAPRV